MTSVTIGVGGPVGSGKTALLDILCKRLRDRFSLAVVTNDIYTHEDAEFLMRSGALPLERIRGVQTGGCPHTAIREDTSINHEALDELRGAVPRRADRLPRVRRRQPGGVVQPRARRRQHLRRSTSPAATRCRARAGPASPAATCSSSTRSTWRRTSAPISASWRATRRRSATGKPVVFTNLKDGDGRGPGDRVDPARRAVRGASARRPGAPRTPFRERRRRAECRLASRTAGAVLRRDRCSHHPLPRERCRAAQDRSAVSSGRWAVAGAAAVAGARALRRRLLQRRRDRRGRRARRARGAVGHAHPRDARYRTSEAAVRLTVRAGGQLEYYPGLSFHFQTAASFSASRSTWNRARVSASSKPWRWAAPAVVSTCGFGGSTAEPS